MMVLNLMNDVGNDIFIKFYLGNVTEQLLDVESRVYNIVLSGWVFDPGSLSQTKLPYWFMLLAYLTFVIYQENKIDQ
jgi:hypothetical protein